LRTNTVALTRVCLPLVLLHLGLCCREARSARWKAATRAPSTADCAGSMVRTRDWIDAYVQESISLVQPPATGASRAALVVLTLVWRIPHWLSASVDQAVRWGARRTGATRRPRRAASAGHTAEAPSAATTSARKWPCRTGFAGLTVGASAASTTAAKSLRTSARTSFAKSISRNYSPSATLKCDARLPPQVSCLVGATVESSAREDIAARTGSRGNPQTERLALNHPCMEYMHGVCCL
jgi:hypothetical protein